MSNDKQNTKHIIETVYINDTVTDGGNNSWQIQPKRQENKKNNCDEYVGKGKK